MWPENIFHQRKHPLGQVIKQVRETGIELLIKQLLSFPVIIDVKKFIAMNPEADIFLFKTPA